jgi:hypothetical protein
MLWDLVQGDLLDVHARDLRRWRTAPEPFHQRCDGRALAGDEDLDPTIGKITRMAAAAELLRALTRGRSEEHTLHST